MQQCSFCCTEPDLEDVFVSFSIVNFLDFFFIFIVCFHSIFRLGPCRDAPTPEVRNSTKRHVLASLFPTFCVSTRREKQGRGSWNCTHNYTQRSIHEWLYPQSHTLLKVEIQLYERTFSCKLNKINYASQENYNMCICFYDGMFMIFVEFISIFFV